MPVVVEGQGALRHGDRVRIVNEAPRDAKEGRIE
jgi:hypothetical protein